MTDSADDGLVDIARTTRPAEMMVSGNLGIGKKGNPVTIWVEDELTGETLEINNVSSAFLIVEDSRKNTSGWLSLAIGGVDRLSEVLSFLTQTTLESLRKITGK